MMAIDKTITNSTGTAKLRKASVLNKPEVLADIHHDLHDMVIWQRDLSADFLLSIDDFLESNRSFKFEKKVSPETILGEMYSTLQSYSCMLALSEDIAKLVELFCGLFDLKQALLRISTVDHTMCPRFHVDRVPCRLITTYQGSATEWLPHATVDRTKLGTGNNGLPDDLSGLYQSPNDVQYLQNGDVALMKGELWEGNVNAGLVHRSPSLQTGEIRLLLTIDFIS